MKLSRIKLTDNYTPIFRRFDAMDHSSAYFIVRCVCVCVCEFKHYFAIYLCVPVSQNECPAPCNPLTMSLLLPIEQIVAN